MSKLRPLPFIPLSAVVSALKANRQAGWRITWLASSERWQGTSVSMCFPDDLAVGDVWTDGVATNVAFQ